MNKRIVSLIAMTVLLGGAKCQPNPLEPNPDVNGGSGGTVFVEAGQPTGGAPGPGDDCGRAEAKAEALGCPLKKPKRASWADVCRNGRANGVDMQDDCVLLAADCQAIHKCTSESAP